MFFTARQAVCGSARLIAAAARWRWPPLSKTSAVTSWTTKIDARQKNGLPLLPGNPAISLVLRPVAFRPRLAAGLA